MAVAAGAVVVDNSSAYRMDENVPLVIPEINGADAAGHRGIIANPNCTTAVTLMALAPLHRAFGVTAGVRLQLSGGVGHGRARHRGTCVRRWRRCLPAGR